MNKSEIAEYQKQIKPWLPGADVTMKDTVIHGLVDECVKIANDIIKRMISN